MYEKDINAITVTEIANQAAISRSDFYNHYLDKYELLQKQASQHIDEIKKRYRRRFSEVDIRDFLSDLTNYIIEERKQLSILIVLPKETEVEFVEQCEVLLRETFISNNHKQTLKNHVPIEYTAKLFASISMTYILHTIEQPYKNQRIINAINEIQSLLFDY
jgi:AcrR family transcriptional regulator